VRKKKTLPSGQ